MVMGFKACRERCIHGCIQLLHGCIQLLKIKITWAFMNLFKVKILL